LRKITFLLGIACLVVGAVPAQAQTYSSRDANGNLVLSDRPLGRNQRTYAVGGAPSVRTTRQPIATYRNQYEDLIVANSQRYGVRADLVRAVIQAESAFNPRARSPKGALGLMQLMPATAREMGVSKVFDPAQNIRGGVAYLKLLLDRYDDNEELALAAYNAGPGAVERYGNTIPPFRETQAYVSRIKGTTDVATVSRPTATAATTAGTSVRPVTPARRVIYKTLELVDGRLIPKYSDHKPQTGNYEVVAR
jgi:soluble lytic murein transglycosylase-like protein